MMTYQVSASVPAAKPPLSAAASGCSPRGPDAALPAYSRSLGVGAGGGRPLLRIKQIRKLPAMEPLGSSRDVNVLQGGLAAGGTPNLSKGDKLDSENMNPEKDTSGGHLAFDQNNVKLDRTRTVIPSLPRLYQTRRPGHLHPLGIPDEFPHGHAGRPFTFGYSERYDLNARPTILLPSNFVLNGRSGLSVESCKFSRPKMDCPTFNLLTVEDYQESPSYMDPMAGASRYFVHRICEISSLEGETVRQEKMRKMRRAAKPPS